MNEKIRWAHLYNLLNAAVLRKRNSLNKPFKNNLFQILGPKSCAVHGMEMQRRYIDEFLITPDTLHTHFHGKIRNHSI